ncbi:hypothetical protein ACFT7S_25700 [Streptomyces sp. NPDC057136]|uniref:hypothetical protein n=1 Tax=Streptomyces sp. NPDC057136 TaxID=3346029 RepID=UPI00363B4B8C
MRRSTPKTDALASHPPVELYDLTTDPDELTDVAEDPAYADIRDNLGRRLSDWMREMGDPLLDGAVTPPLHRRTAAALLGK